MSTGSPGVPWSTQQREWLQALGHGVLMPVPAGSAAEPARSEEHAGGAVPEAVTRGMPKPDAPTRPAQSGSPLLRALARAAGRSEQDAEFLAALPDVATLRGNPAARRALWPRLRALRKRTSP
ncbi:hypothetical protein ACFPOA_03815 [Lysobacter niabensis]|uniref:hypothetical protein n=1 Tax=Agrilutibacter niabensis TaxID=380628 RepID=UPI0036106F44